MGKWDGGWLGKEGSCCHDGGEDGEGEGMGKGEKALDLPSPRVSNHLSSVKSAQSLPKRARAMALV